MRSRASAGVPTRLLGLTAAAIVVIAALVGAGFGRPVEFAITLGFGFFPVALFLGTAQPARSSIYVGIALVAILGWTYGSYALVPDASRDGVELL